MAVRQPRYSKEEFAQRGDVLYEAEVRQQVEEGNHGKIVAIDGFQSSFLGDSAHLDDLNSRHWYRSQRMEALWDDRS